jgi:hypothetical protein
MDKDTALDLAMEALEKCRKGFELTRQYVGYETLPAIEGWSWYDGDVAAKEAITTIKQARSAPTSAEYAMGYAEGFNDGCKPAPKSEKKHD